MVAVCLRVRESIRIAFERQAAGSSVPVHIVVENGDVTLERRIAE